MSTNSLLLGVSRSSEGVETNWVGAPRALRRQQGCKSRSFWMSNKVYDDLDELVDDVKAWIASKNRGFFERGIDMLPEKWEAVIEVDGEYAPE